MHLVVGNFNNTTNTILHMMQKYKHCSTMTKVFKPVMFNFCLIAHMILSNSVQSGYVYVHVCMICTANKTELNFCSLVKVIEQCISAVHAYDSECMVVRDKRWMNLILMKI